MNSENKIFELGDNRVVYYQQFVIAVGVILLFLSVILIVIDSNPYYRLFPLIITVVFLIIILLYSRVYCVKYNSKYFYISNFFKKEMIESSQFVSIKGVKHLEFLIVIIFEKKKVLSLLNSDDFFKNFLKSKNVFYEEKSIEIRKNISSAAGSLP